ncbi:MAG TPA: FtsQ-type POTRA domain-containing protein [Myxococcota bacterium]|nr:FtsQ-type POTRA domain-containing protein [Myxococcota bacterium]HRY91907.1 FtsQ-type POTRA domain-containing protein [Myxococcota bacterium]
MGKRNRKLRAPEERRAGRARLVSLLVWWPLKALLLAAVGGGLGIGAYAVTHYLRTSPALSVRCIEVHGATRTHREELLRLADLREGSNVFAVDLASAEERLLRHPWVRRAVVRRVVPDRLVVEIEEHQPAALVALEDLYVADSEGRLFKRLQPADGLDLPVLTGFDRDTFRREPERVAQGVRACLGLLRAIEANTCLAERRVAEVHHDELTGLGLTLDPGAVSVRLGREAPAARLPWLCQLLDELAERRLVAHSILLDHGATARWATVRVEGLRADETLEPKNPG